MQSAIFHPAYNYLLLRTRFDRQFDICPSFIGYISRMRICGDMIEFHRRIGQEVIMVDAATRKLKLMKKNPDHLLASSFNLDLWRLISKSNDRTLYCRLFSPAGHLPKELNPVIFSLHITVMSPNYSLFDLISRQAIGQLLLIPTFL